MQQTSRTLSRRQAFWLFTGAGVAAGALSGCGAGSGVTSAAGAGRATLTVAWPDATRLIPAAASSITVRFTLEGIEVAAQTIARPSSGGTSTLTFDTLPVGALTATATAYPTTTGSGVAQATATTTAVIVVGQTTSITVTMASTIDRLTVSPTSPSVEAGSTVALTATALNASGAIVLTASGGFTWSSLTPSVASVSASGVVTGIASGTAQIQVTESESGKVATVAVTVTSPIASCSLIPSETDGPYPLYSVLSNASMVRSAIAESKTGVPLTVELTLVRSNGGCAVIPNAYIYIWHCDKDGQYSGYSSGQNGNHAGETLHR